MNHLSVKRSALSLAALSAASLLVACQDKRVKELNTGITQDSVMSVISQNLKPGSGPDSMPNVYKKERFLVQGKTFEVLYFTSDNQKAPPPVNPDPKSDTVPLKRLTPLVFFENRLVAKGWDAWDSVAAANKIQISKP